MQGWLNLLVFKLAAVPISILALFLVYWLLPNRKIPPARVAPPAIVVGLVLEALKYVNLAITPYCRAKLEHEYFIFRHSVAILLWSFVASMVVLAGAEWTRAHRRGHPADGGNGRFGYRSMAMKDWAAIAKARGPGSVRAARLDRIAKPLAESGRDVSPSVETTDPRMEPASELHHGGGE